MQGDTAMGVFTPRYVLHSCFSYFLIILAGPSATAFFVVLHFKKTQLPDYFAWDDFKAITDAEFP